MKGDRSRCAADSVEGTVRQPETGKELEEYMDILEELEFAMDDIGDELEDIQLRIRKVGRQLQRFRPLPAKRYDVIKEQDEFPFE